MAKATTAMRWAVQVNFEGAWVPSPGRTPKAAAAALAGALGLASGALRVRPILASRERVTRGFDAWRVGGDRLLLTPRGSGVVDATDRSPPAGR